MPHYDVIVLGCGGVGSAALQHAAQRGAKVLGFDRFSPPHNSGSSHGQTRIIRLAYFEKPDYVPALRRAYQLWGDLEAATQRRLYHEVGLLEFGPADGVLIPGVLRAAQEHSLDVEMLDPAQIHEHFPGFFVPPHFTAVFEARAGYLLVEECVSAQIEMARRQGARLETNTAVRSWKPTATGVEVVADSGVYTADRLIVSAGAWAGPQLAELGVKLSPVRKAVFWYRPEHDVYRSGSGGAGFIVETPAGEFYGLPDLAPHGLKVAEHSGGKPLADPLHVDRSVHLDDQQRVERFTAEYLPALGKRLTRHETCIYTLSPDSHFLVDRLPDAPQVSFAAGLSGHGFKFAPVLGEALVELALDGKTSLSWDFLSVNRFAPPE
ncbi:MAG TPA: N-methyl-L-tryptophan oxidase [Pirellulales bacterium]